MTDTITNAALNPVITKTPWAVMEQQFIAKGWAERGSNGELRNRRQIESTSLSGGCPPVKMMISGWNTKMKALWFVKRYTKATGNKPKQAHIEKFTHSGCGRMHIKPMLTNADGVGVFLTEEQISTPRLMYLYKITEAAEYALEEWSKLNSQFDEECSRKFAELFPELN